MKLYDSGIYLENGQEIIEEENMTKPACIERRGSQEYHRLWYSKSTQYIRKYGETSD